MNDNNCDHMDGYWVTTYEEDWYTGEMERKDTYVTEQTLVDIDTHRYKCTQCNKIMYYSGRAQRYYEEGDRSDDVVEALFGF